MYIDEIAVRKAYRKHGEIYGNGAWNISYHVQCWRYAKHAFDEPSLAGFERIYEELRRRWQALRNPARTPWTAAETFDRFRALPEAWRHVALSDFDDAGLFPVWNIINEIKDIKPLKGAPSVVAISKFLHFWNPKLFVIVDYEVIWRWVFGHRWLKQPIEQARATIRTLLPNAVCLDAGQACDLLSYLAVIRWSADTIRANPTLRSCFAEHVRQHADDDVVDLPLHEYEAAAIEWLLLGLVHLPPDGVSFA